MIKVKLQLEPLTFDERVRQSGLASLVKNPNRTKLTSYWRRCLPELHRAYKGICAYYAIYIDPATTYPTADHYKPKSQYPNLAYEWDNYRLACPKANTEKGNKEDILDPFLIPDDLFYIDFPTGTVQIRTCYISSLGEEAKDTIDSLKLNSRLLTERRKKDIKRYLAGKCSLDDLAEFSPFVHREIVKQNLIK